MRRYLVVGLTVGLLSACSSQGEPTRAAADQTVCSEQAVQLQQARSVVGDVGASTASQAAATAQVGISDVTGWQSQAQDADLQRILGQVLGGLQTISRGAGDGLDDADVREAGIYLDTLDQWCGA